METTRVVIRLMQAEDIEGAMELKTIANWNQTRMDWERVLRLEPKGCFVDEREGVIAGTTTALRYQSELAWIGMVLVLPAFRRTGIARGLMQHALNWLGECGITVTRLDATSMGHPLYRQLGFRDLGVIERWERPASGVYRGAVRNPTEELELSDSLLALDREACGYDRSALLRDLSSDPSVECVRSVRGFAFGRPGSAAWYAGPCVARSEGDAESLLRSLLAPHAADRVYWDLLPGSDPTRRLAERLGFHPSRSLVRMERKDAGGISSEGQPSQVYSAAGFEFG